MNAAQCQSGEIPSARIVVLDPGRRSRVRGIKCVLGKNLKIRPEVLGEYCLRDMEPHVEDLIVIAGAVGFADRVVPRNTATVWRRELEVVVPVLVPDLWSSTAVSRILHDVLRVLTGDDWFIQFSVRQSRLAITPAALALEGGTSAVIPFSEGLDSFAVSQLICARPPHVNLVGVTTGRKREGARCGNGYRVSIPFAKNGGPARFRETSYRSRGFIFGVMAGVAAYLLNAERIIVPESGQGTFGPWLLPVGNETPDVRTHPLFTSRLSKLFEASLGRYIPHDHPQMWKTKGETLRDLRAQGLDDGWWETKSCPRKRNVLLDHKRIHCGICPSCLLRRQSLLAAGLDEGRDQYLWEDLSAPSLSEAAVSGARATDKNDERQAKCAVSELARLAGVPGSTRENRLLAKASFELDRLPGIPDGQISDRIRRLLAQHQNEWWAFVASHAKESFINQWLDVIQC